ncbi:sulfurtransferase TusA family protein [Moraxella sp. ZJ142]|uniref:sulfurtransferase TusA family protein n=1 Tax=Moraxella marmotae TaxID=3344520 RepID=UPI0035D4D9B0
MIFDTLDSSEQAFFAQSLSAQLAQLGLDSQTVASFFDARQLPCPMPLLKAKITLRGVAGGQALYLVATDKNSQTDLMAYCQKNALTAHTWRTDGDGGAIYHFIIIKPL